MKTEADCLGEEQLGKLGNEEEEPTTNVGKSSQIYVKI